MNSTDSFLFFYFEDEKKKKRQKHRERVMCQQQNTKLIFLDSIASLVINSIEIILCVTLQRIEFGIDTI